MTNPVDIVARVLPLLPTPLVGSVCYDGQKQTKVCTPKAHATFADLFTVLTPTHILEIGTHAGGSALMMLAYSEASITSVDIGQNWIEPTHSFSDWGTPSSEGGLNQVERVLREQFPNRFTLIIGDSTAESTRARVRAAHEAKPFDLAFIDGNHEYSYVARDIAFARSLGITQFIMDDYNGPESDVGRAVREAGLEVVKEWTDIHSRGVSIALTKVG